MLHKNIIRDFSELPPFFGNLRQIDYQWDTLTSNEQFLNFNEGWKEKGMGNWCSRTERYDKLNTPPHHLFHHIEVSKKFLNDAENAYKKGQSAFRTFFDDFNYLEANNVNEFHIVIEVQQELFREYSGYLEKSQDIKNYIPIYRHSFEYLDSLFKDKEGLKFVTEDMFRCLRGPVSKMVGNKENWDWSRMTRIANAYSKGYSCEDVIQKEFEGLTPKDLEEKFIRFLDWLVNLKGIDHRDRKTLVRIILEFVGRDGNLKLKQILSEYNEKGLKTISNDEIYPNRFSGSLPFLEDIKDLLEEKKNTRPRFRIALW